MLMVISPVDVLILCARYWDKIHGQWAILDPSFHTMTGVRRRSALLTTVILALASTALTYTAERSHSQVTEALSLHAHIDRLIWVIFATGARSIEIIQAHIVSDPRTSLFNSRQTHKMGSFSRVGVWRFRLNQTNYDGREPQ